MDKLLGKLRLVVEHSFSSLLPPIFGALVALSVIRLASAERWGEVVDVFVVAQLAAHIAAWGNKEHLLRAFSVAPDDASRAWATSLRTRAALIAPFAAAALVGYGILGQGWSPAILAPALLWIAGRIVVQSHDVVILYHRLFRAQIAVETTGTAVVLGVLLLTLPDISAAGILWLFAGVEVAKAVALRTLTGDHVSIATGARADPSLLRESAPFLLLGLSGLLGSRVDLYCVAAALDAREVARYQVLINMLLYLQALSNFILLPFVRDVYAMELRAILGLAVRFTAAGAGLSAIGVGAVAALMRYAYRLPLEPELLAIGYLYVVQMYLALPLIYALYKAGRERVVLHSNIGVVAVNLVGNVLLIPRLGLVGALLSTMVVQTAAALLYLWRVRVLAGASGGGDQSGGARQQP